VRSLSGAGFEIRNATVLTHGVSIVAGLAAIVDFPKPAAIGSDHDRIVILEEDAADRSDPVR
jgi:hypothetical protein